MVGKTLGMGRYISHSAGCRDRCIDRYNPTFGSGVCERFTRIRTIDPKEVASAKLGPNIWCVTSMNCFATTRS